MHDSTQGRRVVIEPSQDPINLAVPGSRPNFTALPNWVLDDDQLDGSHLLILLALQYHGAEIRPSVKTLAARSRLNASTVKRKLRELQAQGLVIVEARHDDERGQLSNRYHLRIWAGRPLMTPPDREPAPGPAPGEGGCTGSDGGVSPETVAHEAPPPRSRCAPPSLPVRPEQDSMNKTQRTRRTALKPDSAPVGSVPAPAGTGEAPRTDEGNSQEQPLDRESSRQAFETLWKLHRTSAFSCVGPKSKAWDIYRELLRKGKVTAEQLQQAMELAIKTRTVQDRSGQRPTHLPYLCRWLKRGDWEALLEQLADQQQAAAERRQTAVVAQESTRAMIRELFALGDAREAAEATSAA